MFRVGQKVVCVDDSPCPNGSVPWKIIGDLDGLSKGGIYTIRKVGGYAGIGTLVWLNEIIRPLTGNICAKHGEAGYLSTRFRPVVDRISASPVGFWTAVFHANNPANVSKAAA
jgi:hypothetical protein